MARLPIDLYVNLLREGYTPEEIRNYSNGTPEPPNIISQPTPDPAPTEPETPNIILQPTPDPAPTEPENTNNDSAALVTEMRQLVAMMRNANIRDVTMPSESAPDAAQVMATILSPQKNN